MGPELDLRPQLERLDRLIFWSEGIDEGTLSFAFRPLWQLDESAKAALALAKAQATQFYVGLKLWPDAVMARLAEAQLVADETYPSAAAVSRRPDRQLWRAAGWWTMRLLSLATPMVDGRRWGILSSFPGQTLSSLKL